MSYTVLARKWRPQGFGDVVGQAHVTRALTNALEMGRIAHAYLFSGTRGVGKTTTARILAKALNCVNGPTANPCGVCDSCREITSGSSVDVIEIDGASNTGVDNVRELRENVKYAPAKGARKVYIIDEVHMLSTAAFNALLKTLEEPPPHVVFIFATTDPHKIPATILSRCQHYDFRRVPKSMIASHLRTLCDREGIKVEDGAIGRLAALAEGSVRDSLSLMDQVVSYCGEEGVRESDIEDILGLVGREAVVKAASRVIGQDPAGAFAVVDELMDLGHDLKRFSSTLLEFFRDLLVVKVAGKGPVPLDLPDSELASLRDMAESLSPEEAIRVMNLLARLCDDMRNAPHPRITLELALVKAASRPYGTVDELLASIKGQREPGGQAQPMPKSAARPSHGVVREPTAAYKPAPSQAVAPSGESSATDFWVSVAASVKGGVHKDSPVNMKVKNCAPIGFKGDGFEVALKQEFLSFKTDEVALIEEAMTQLKGDAVKLLIVSPEKGKDKKSLVEVKKARETERKDKLRSEAMDDPVVKAAVDLFGGELVDVMEEVKNV